MRLFLGVDGGGTRTRAFVCDDSGSRGATAEAGVSNPNHADPEEVCRNLKRAVEDACAALGALPSEIESAFFGIAGVTDEAGREQVCQLAARSGLGHARLGADHDIRIALHGGLEGRPGIALIVGTGSSCYGRTADGRTWQTGGWESLLSDEGSGYYLGRAAMVAAVRMADGRAEATELKRRIFEWLGITEPGQIIHRVHRGGLSKTEIASLAPMVLQLTESGDMAALDLLRRGARQLAVMVAANHRRLPTGPGPEVVVTGGLGAAEGNYRELIYAAIQEELPAAHVGPPALAPVVGAALLAMEQAGITPSPGALKNWKQLSA